MKKRERYTEHSEKKKSNIHVMDVPEGTQMDRINERTKQ